MSDYLVRVKEICNQADKLEDESELIKGTTEVIPIGKRSCE